MGFSVLCISLGCNGYKRNSDLPEETILSGINFPAQHRCIDLFKHPGFLISQKYGAVTAVKHIVTIVKRGGKACRTNHIDAAGEFDYCLNSVVNIPSVVPQPDLAKSVSQRRTLIQIPGSQVNLMESHCTYQSDRSLPVQAPVKCCGSV